MIDNRTRYSNDKFRAIFEFQGRRQDWLAAQLDIDPSYASKLLSGDKPLTPSLAARVALLLGIPVNLLSQDETEREPVNAAS